MSKFEGFRSRAELEKFTAIPNQFFDDVMKKLNGNEMKILLTIFRKTYGWVKGSDMNGNPVYKIEDDISLSQFKKFTGIGSINTIKKHLKNLIKKGYIIKTKDYNKRKNKSASYAIRTKSMTPVSKIDRGGVSNSDRGPVSKIDSTKESNIKKKTEEEENQNFPQQNKESIPDNVNLKFKQVFNRKLSPEFYEKLTKKYSDPKIIMKALEVAEANADKPSYLLKILSDWQNNGLTSISSINTYLEERKAKNQANKAKKETSATASDSNDNEPRSMEELYQEGYRW